MHPRDEVRRSLTTAASATSVHEAQGSSDITSSKCNVEPCQILLFPSFQRTEFHNRHAIRMRQNISSTAMSKSTNASIQAFLPPTPSTSSTKDAPSSSFGDGFTTEEVQEALRPTPLKPWQPPGDYTEVDIRDLYPGPQAVTFMGRVANIYDVANSPKSPRSAKGCVKLTVKDDGGAITVRVWYASRYPHVRLGSLVSVWTSHSELVSYGGPTHPG